VANAGCFFLVVQKREEGGDPVTGHIISTTIGGKNGEPKRVSSLRGPGSVLSLCCAALVYGEMCLFFFVQWFPAFPCCAGCGIASFSAEGCAFSGKRLAPTSVLFCVEFGWLVSILPGNHTAAANFVGLVDQK
jgi:hypothetical protein